MTASTGAVPTGGVEPSGHVDPFCRDALPPREREAVVLKYVGDLDHRAVAAALGTSPAMSRRLVSDALATLRLDAEDLR